MIFEIDLQKLDYKFIQKPLLIGGKAMEFYNLRKSGNDIDFIAAKQDVLNLIKIYPESVKDLWGDLGVCPMEFEIWKTICLFTYDDLKTNAIEMGNFLIISEENLLFTKALAMKKEKYFNDTQLLVEDILKKKYKELENINKENSFLLSEVKNIKFIEKTGPQN